MDGAKHNTDTLAAPDLKLCWRNVGTLEKEFSVSLKNSNKSKSLNTLNCGKNYENRKKSQKKNI